MQKKSKKKVISILTVLTMLLSTCFMFASCGDDSETGGETETLKFSIQIYDDNDEVICNLSDQEITGADITISDATKQAAESIGIDVVLDSDDTVSKIGNLESLVSTPATDTEDEDGEAEENEENAAEEDTEETTEAETYYWEVWVNDSKDPVSPKQKLKDGDSIVWKWVLWVDPVK